MAEYLQPFRLFGAGLIQNLFAQREAEALADADTLSDTDVLADTAYNVGLTVVDRHAVIPPQVEAEFRYGPPRSIGEAGDLHREFTLKMRLAGEPQLLRLTPLNRTPTEIEARLNNEELWITISDSKQSL